MPHTGHILHGRYAVVSCHVERPLDDEVWRRFSALQERRPGGFAVAALMRPPAEGEDEQRWLTRARAARARAPFGLHTHWTSPTHARPTGGDPAERVRREAEWMCAQDLAPRFFCGGGWYTDEGVRAAVRELGDRKSTRMNSSHRTISYAVLCLKKKKKKKKYDPKKIRKNEAKINTQADKHT